MRIQRDGPQINRDGPQEKQAEKEDKPNDNGGIAGTPPFPGNISVKNTIDIRRLLVGIINQLRKEKFDVQVARAQIYAAHELREVFAQTDLEQRVRNLEELSGYGGR